MFVLPFRELNLIKDDQYSLHRLLCYFHPEIKDLDPKIYDVCKVVFIFDGLDESRIQLNFSQCNKVSDISMTSSVGVLMSNLIKGELLPSALIWITSRPAAANEFSPQYINRVTEIQGFTDPQKEEYFRKRVSDQDQAEKIISHIKTAKTLHIMCHIPVFCWISVMVLQEILKQTDTEIPKTLTEMYTQFLHTQINMKNEKYEGKKERDQKKHLESNRSMILKLAELAFKQLMKGNVLFYEEDLRECGIDVTEASMYSGICTEIFREESVLYQRKIYCFVHLSFQEFLAALYVFHCFLSNKMRALQTFKLQPSCRSENVPLHDLLKAAVYKALESQNGHLDLFLRFLLGISLEPNQSLLQGLLTHTHSSQESVKKTVLYIKDQIKTGHLHIERSINLFLCLSEMKDQSLAREIQEYLLSEKHSGKKLSPGQCSVLACMLLTSEEVLDELDLKKYNTSEEGYRRLIPAAANSRKALLGNCSLDTDLCKNLCSILASSNSPLRELCINISTLQDEGMKLLSDGLKTHCKVRHCKLEILSLTGCNLTTDNSKSLFSVLTSEKSFLKELNIRNYDFQDSGVEQLSAALKSSHCKLEILRIALFNLGELTCGNLGSALQLENSSLRQLELSNNRLQDSGVKLLSKGLESSHCTLEILKLAMCNLGEQTCEILGSALQLANNPLRELDLSNNDLQDSGVKLLSSGLKSSHCKLESLRLSGCLVTEEGCSSLASALHSNPSHLKELDLMYNHPGESGVKLLSARLEDPHYACDLTLDPNTAHTRLSLSEGNRKVTRVWEQQPYPDHPDRFDVCVQVVCRESLTGPCYWEAEWSGGRVEISVTYKGISRKGDSGGCGFGHNVKSWSLNCTNISYSVWHNKKRTAISAPPCSSNRVGVYLDWAAGTLSFYNVSSHTHTLTHLHTFHSTFTEPLYVGFRLWDSDSSVHVCTKYGVPQVCDTKR
uniref:B30.2/SPRY domain-containing protein n=1 Tax=Electrophorus electricus TaxID=8005 RepID=A0AAY5F2T0_ELEEL